MPYFDTAMAKLKKSHDHEHMKLDRFGMVMSFLCLIHCLGTPFLILIFPALTEAHGLESWLHGLLAAILIPVALLAVTQGYPHHKKKIVAMLAGAGAALISMGVLLPLLLSEGDSHQHLSNSVRLTIIGSFCLGTCHFLNLYYCRKYKSAKTCSHSTQSQAPQTPKPSGGEHQLESRPKLL